MDKCYKLHGYPPGYKPRSTTQSKGNSSRAQAHQTSSTVGEDLGQGSTDSSLSLLTSAQCEHLIALLSSQFQSSSRVPSESQQPVPCVSSFSGIFSIASLIPLSIISSSSWVLDTSATHHVCCSVIVHSFQSCHQLLRHPSKWKLCLYQSCWVCCLVF